MVLAEGIGLLDGELTVPDQSEIRMTIHVDLIPVCRMMGMDDDQSARR